MKTALVIMAAGIGSRYGGGIKQLAPVGPNGEIIMEYSLHDAIEAGFNKVVVIIRHSLEKAFYEAIGQRMEANCRAHGVELCYAYQELEDVPVAFTGERQKPWGTGHAVLACKGILREPFVVINADDYYGKTAFQKIHEFLCQAQRDDELCMAGFRLKNTLSESGGVTRGVCHMERGMLTDVKETRNIVKTAQGAEANGCSLDLDALVSMNMWGLNVRFLELLEEGFVSFFADHASDISTAEFLLPVYIDQLLKAGKVSVQVLDTPDKWFGVTYQADKDLVVSSFRQLIADGVYQADLFSDLA